MSPRANWKGYLKIGELTCPVALYTAASTSDRVTFHTINRESGHRVHRQFVDGGTGKPVDRDDQVKGYEVGPDQYVVLEPDEIAAAVPDSDKTLAVSAFIKSSEIDDVYFDKPYYLAPSDARANEIFVLLRDGLKAKQVAALAQTVIFRRVRTFLVRAHESGLIATTLNFDYEVRPAATAFDDVSPIKIQDEMLDLAKHIIQTKAGEFDPATFDDRYDAALAELVKAKIEGRKIKPVKAEAAGQVVDLMAALRESAKISKKNENQPASGKRKAS